MSTTMWGPDLAASAVAELLNGGYCLLMDSSAAFAVLVPGADDFFGSLIA
jgi:hypothetical protein